MRRAPEPASRRLWLVGLAVLLSACSVFPQSQPLDIYRLPPPSIGDGQAAPADVSLRIARPAAGDVLSSSRIAVVPGANRLSVYEGVRWSSPVPALWRDYLLDAFHNDGRIGRLSSADEGLQADFELGGALGAFQAEYREGSPTVVIRFDARLVDTANRRILASRRFAATAQVTGEQVPEVVGAFGRAGDELAEELIEWALSQLN